LERWAATSVSEWRTSLKGARDSLSRPGQARQLTIIMRSAGASSPRWDCAGRQASRHDIDRRDYCYWHRRRRQGQTRTTGEILQLLLRCMTVESRRGTGRGVPGREFASQAECSWSVPWRWEWQCRWDWGIGAWGWGWQCDHGSWIMLDRQMGGGGG
jgi:hypothetical protein